LIAVDFTHSSANAILDELNSQSHGFVLKISCRLGGVPATLFAGCVERRFSVLNRYVELSPIQGHNGGYESASLPGKMEVPPLDGDLRRSGQDSGEVICCQ
jgi:hypothetical protein